MRREPCLLPVRRATKSTKGSHSPLALPSSHRALAVLLAQGAACGTPHGGRAPQTRQADTQRSLMLFPLYFLLVPSLVWGLWPFSIMVVPVLRSSGFALKAAATSEASLLCTQDLQPGMVGDNPATPLQQGAQMPQPGYTAVSLHLPTTLHSISKTPHARLKTMLTASKGPGTQDS